ncbi:MAG: glycoside hydrolase family 13 protein [Acidobacteriota bacterium]
MAKTSARTSSNSDPWWKHAVIYELYPRSFADSNGDGIGDLDGATAHLDYLQKLGIDSIWLAPIYPSPNVDFGYDVSDYTAVNPEYGTLADFDRLLAEAKKRNMNIIMDFVVNHTSDKNPWFIESASSRTNPKADWYVWNDGVPADTPNLSEIQKQSVHDGLHGKVVPPNNWGFRSSAWEWVPARKQFYYHAFSAAQPDLNWRNPAVEKAMFDAMRFWLDRGVAGFRLDAIETVYEDPTLRNIPEGRNRMAAARGITMDLPEVHGLLRRMRALVDSYPGQRVLIGELFARDMPTLDSFYGGAAKDELQLPMDYFYGFPALLNGFKLGSSANKDKLDVDYYRRHLAAMTTELHGSQPLIFFDNHDRERSIDRFGDGVHNLEIARVVATLQLAVPATPQLYYGQAIGMVTTPPTRRQDVRDGFAKNSWPRNKGRDGERTPMQWTPGPQAGFSTNPDTWLPIPPSYKKTNVQTEESDPDSLLHWYQSLIALRRSNLALRNSGIVLLDTSDTNVLSFLRPASGKGKPVVVMMNFTAAPQTVSIHLADAGIRSGKPHTLLASPGTQVPTNFQSVALPPYGVVLASVD